MELTQDTDEARRILEFNLNSLLDSCFKSKTPKNQDFSQFSLGTEEQLRGLEVESNKFSSIFEGIFSKVSLGDSLNEIRGDRRDLICLNLMEMCRRLMAKVLEIKLSTSPSHSLANNHFPEQYHDNDRNPDNRYSFPAFEEKPENMSEDGFGRPKMLSLDPSLEISFSTGKQVMSVKAMMNKEKENSLQPLQSSSRNNPDSRSSSSYADRTIRNYKDLMEHRKNSKSKDDLLEPRHQRIPSFEKAQKMRKYLEKFSGMYSKADERLQKKLRAKSPNLLTLNNH